MAIPTAPSLSPPEATDLDTRILRVEQRLIAREEALRGSLETMVERVRLKLLAGRRALAVVGVSLAVSVLGGWVAWKLLRGSRRAPAAGRHAGGAPEAERHGEIPWVRLLALAWPLLPAGWRSQVTPATASTLVAVGLPLVERLLQGRKPAPLITMPSVDPARFAGNWFVLAQLPPPRTDPKAPLGTLSYVRRPDGDFDVLAVAPGAPGGSPTRGIAQVEPGSGGARLRCSLWPVWLRWLPLAWAQHGILHVDATYGEALLGSSDRDHLWLLARRPQLAAQRWHALLQLAHERGFAVERLHQHVDPQGPAAR